MQQQQVGHQLICGQCSRDRAVIPRRDLLDHALQARPIQLEQGLHG
jgi:hypothetical protein